MNTYEVKHGLYSKYIEELSQIAGVDKLMEGNECRKCCDEYISAKDSSWHNVFGQDGKLVGFLIIGKEVPERHPDALRSVAQAYVLPEYRSRGLMSAALSDYMSRHRGVYSILVLKDYTNAKEIWNHLFKKNGYRECGLDREYVSADDCDLLGFEPID